MEAEYNMDLKIQKSNWNQLFQRHLQRVLQGRQLEISKILILHNTVVLRQENGSLVESTHDLVGDDPDKPDDGDLPVIVVIRHHTFRR